jgi:hypothetical protein
MGSGWQPPSLDDARYLDITGDNGAEDFWIVKLFSENLGVFIQNSQKKSRL